MTFDGVFGNERLKEYIRGCVEKRGFPNSLIIAGEEGSGRHTFARIVACALNCRAENKPCFDCPACRKIMSDECPDVTVISLKDDKKTIGVNDITDMRSDAYIAPSECDNRVFIIENADLMTESAQNALLKIFEEPPKSVYFILLCKTPSSLLPTVRSRAPELYTERFEDEVLSSYLRENDGRFKRLYADDGEKFLTVIRMSNGSIGKAVGLISSPNAVKSIEKAAEIVDTVSGGSESDLISVLRRSLDKRENAISVLSSVLDALRDIVSCRRNREDVPLLFYTSREKAAKCCTNLNVKTLVAVYETVLDAFLKIQNDNVNLNTAAVALASEVASVRK